MSPSNHKYSDPICYAYIHIDLCKKGFISINQQGEHNTYLNINDSIIQEGFAQAIAYELMMNGEIMYYIPGIMLTFTDYVSSL